MIKDYIVSLLVSFGLISTPLPAPAALEYYGNGSGGIISSDGYVLSVDHVACQANTRLFVVINGLSYPAKAIKCDHFHDLALVKIDVPNGTMLPYLPLSSQLQYNDNQDVYRFGFDANNTYQTGHYYSSFGWPNLFAGRYYNVRFHLYSFPGDSGAPIVNNLGAILSTTNAIDEPNVGVTYGSSTLFDVSDFLKGYNFSTKPQLPIWDMQAYLQERVVRINIYTVK